MTNAWQNTMYDHVFAEKTLNSSEMHLRAGLEAKFLMDKLNLPTGASILDVPCGTGRHSRLFAENGFHVVGVDLNPACLAIANKNPHPNLKFHQGNLQNLSGFQGKFDCVLNLFTSFGYFSTDEENTTVMGELAGAVRPGGKLVLNLINRTYLMSVFKPVFTVKVGNTFVVSASQYDPKTFYNECWITVKDEVTGETSLSYHRARIYSPEEIVTLMKDFGFRDIEVYGDLSGAELDETKSSHPFYVGIKA